AAAPNMLVHSADEYAWPPKTTALAVRVVRLFSTVLGLLTLIFIYQAILSFGFEPIVALVGIATLAFSPRYILLSSTVTNDVACACAAAGLMALLARYVADDQSGQSLSMLRMFVLGVVSGLAFLTKLNAIIVVAPVGIAMLWCARDKSGLDIRKLMRWGLAFLAGFALVAGPYLVYSTIKYGDPLATAQRDFILTPYKRKVPLALGDLPGIALRLVQTSWDYFGAGGLVTPYQTMGFILAGLTLAGLVIAIARRQLPVRSIGFLIPLSLMGAMLIVYVVWLFRDEGSAYAKYFVPALLFIQLLAGIALTTLFRKWMKTVAGWIALFAGAIGAALVMLFLVVPAYQTVIYLSPAKARALPAEGRITFDNGIQLVSASPDKVRLDPGETLNLHVLWHLVSDRATLQYLVIQVNDQSGRQLSRQVILPFGGRYNTNQWGPGVLEDMYPIQMPPVTQTSLVSILLGWYQYDAPHLVARVTPSGAESAVVATVKVRGTRQPDAVAAQPARATFGQSIALEGYDLQDGRLTLYWRSLKPVDKSYSVFVHLLDANGKLASQADGPVPYATLFWDTGEQVLDVRALTSLNGVKAISVGLYDAQTGQRLGAQSDTLQVVDNAVTVWRQGQ
ncbi:MAG TPA: phospholipid carrier-dependent glycosyltransferase, partial [Anaerolineae bacterium]